ncbi:MAG: Holliday junction resolvase YqgF, putative holliday junction resolvase [Candidatus Parcubacteria bacterium]|nr:Holliday junction resolvase YqgF, putative holliday junction resolvase [Candidatus Parcubacteria bacterium]
MRIMGIDYGSKRVGIAVSDEGAEFALPFAVIPNNADLASEIVEIARENQIEELVMGESRKDDMSANAILPATLALKKVLEAHKFTVHMELEFMTSVAAERFQGKNDKIDASAAALILQSFLDTRRSKA